MGCGLWLHRTGLLELGSPVIPLFGAGEAAGEFVGVAGADEFVHGGVAGRRHRPVIAGRLAAPDPPLRIPAPQPLQAGILVVPPVVRGHLMGRLRWTAVAVPATSPAPTVSTRPDVGSRPRCCRCRQARPAAGVIGGPLNGAIGAAGRPGWRCFPASRRPAGRLMRRLRSSPGQPWRRAPAEPPRFGGPADCGARPGAGRAPRGSRAHPAKRRGCPSCYCLRVSMAAASMVTGGTCSGRAPADRPELRFD
jgi:hypothetical protein